MSLRPLLLAALLACRPAPAQAPAPAAPHDAAITQTVVEPARGWLGVRFEPGSTRVVQVVERSPAAKAGLRVDDELASIDGVAMTTSQQIVKAVAEAPPGSTIQLVVRRGGAPLDVAVKLATRPPDEHLIRDSLLGKRAPDFTTTGLDGGSVALADLRGQVVLLDFWATWCGPCTTQYPHLNAWHDRYAAKGLRIVALSDEEPDLVREYAKAEKLGYPIALDPDQRVRAAYFVPGMPTTVLVDRTGIVRYVAVGVANPVEVEAAIDLLLK